MKQSGISKLGHNELLIAELAANDCLKKIILSHSAGKSSDLILYWFC